MAIPGSPPTPAPSLGADHLDRGRSRSDVGRKVRSGGDSLDGFGRRAGCPPKRWRM